MTDERIEELEQKVDALEARLDARKRKFDRLVQLVCGDSSEFAALDVAAEQDVLGRFADVDQRMHELEDDVASALATARTTRPDGGRQKTKKEIPKSIARNEVVRREATGDTGEKGRAVTVGEVQTRAEPQHELKYQTVKDAFRTLSREWDCIYVKTSPRRVVLREQEATRELTVVVEDDLGRSDLTKQLISENSHGGV